MTIMNYAFIMNSQALTPKTYHGKFQSSDRESAFYGVNTFEMAKDFAKELAIKGVERIDLCGDFDERAAKEIQKATGRDTHVAWMNYFPEEVKKVEALESLDHFGFIILDQGAKEGTTKLVMKSAEFTTHIVSADNLANAREAAQKLVEEGIDFIELSSDFDAAMARTIIEKIDGKVPIGFAGKNA
jgi:hypothetical protein